MSVPGLVWRPPPGWPEPPPGWVPPAGWSAPAEWPAPPPGWVYWVPATGPQTTGPQTTGPPSPGTRPQAAPPPPARSRPSPVRVAEQSRRGLVLETWFVQLAFLVPSVLAAVDLLAARTGGAAITRFPTIVSNPVANLILGVLTYLQVAAMVPIALLLLSRTGQSPAERGLGRPTWRRDVWPGLGIPATRYRVALPAPIVLTPLGSRHRELG